MFKGLIFSMILFGLLNSFSQASAESTISGILLQEGEKNTRIMVLVDKDVHIRKKELKKTGQVIYSFENAILSRPMSPLKPSSKVSNLVQMVPYQENNMVKLAFQLKKKSASVRLRRDNGGVIFDIGSGGSFKTTKRKKRSSRAIYKDRIKVKKSAPEDENLDDTDLDDELEGTTDVAADGKAPGDQGGNDMTLTSSGSKPSMDEDTTGIDPNSGDEALDVIDQMRTERKYRGKKVTFQVRNASLVDVFDMIANASGFNIVMSDEIRGTITMSLFNVPWDQVLDIILNAQKLGYERSGNVLRIAPLKTLTEERQAKMQAKKAAISLEPMVTKFIPLSFAETDGMKTILSNYLTKNDAAGRSGTINNDIRTNSLIVTDIAENIEKISRVVTILDTQTPQVLVEAKIVEAKEEFSRTYSGALGWFNAIDKNSESNAIGLGSNGGPQSAFTLAGLQGATKGGLAANVQLASIVDSGTGKTRNLNALLQLGENDSALRVISNPRIVVLNKKTASITQGAKIPFTTRTVSGGVTTLATEFVDTQLVLTVTPQVTNEGSISMNINIDRSFPSGGQGGESPTVETRGAQTEVLIDSGSTLVLGGIYTSTHNEGNAGIPLLRKLPLIGWLFGTDNESDSKTELLMFITPRIINEKAAGLRS